MMKKSKGIIKAGFKLGMAYRTHFFVGLIRVPIALVIYYFLWSAIYSYNSTDVIKGFTFNDMIAYYVMSMIVAMFTWCDIETWMEEDVRSGDVANDFLRPIKYMYMLFNTYLGLVVLGLLIQLVPIIILSVIFMKLVFPSTIYLLLFLLSVVIAMLMSFLLAFCLGLTAFWLTNIKGLRRVKSALSTFLEGGLIPLSFFPAAAQTVFMFLPFMYMRYVPINIFLQKYTLTQTWIYIGIELLWLIILYLFSLFFYRKAFKKFSGSGV